LATFAYWTGWRRSEILSLEWSRVDRKAGTIRLDAGTTKNRDGREFMYKAIPDLHAVIQRQWTAHEALTKQTPSVLCPRVFHRKGKPIRSLRKAWDAACRAAGCPGRLLHDCRRTAVRNLERAGVSRSVAMQLTGHKTESVYRRYAIVSNADLTDAARRLARTGAVASSGPGAASTGSVTGVSGLDAVSGQHP
jgi:integrase